MIPYYLFETLSLIYLVGALITGFYLIKNFKNYKFKGVIVPVFLFLGIVFLFKIHLEPYQIIFRQEKLETNKLQNEIKIALMSDFHFRPWKDGNFFEKITQKLEQENPDLIVLTGDFLFYDNIEKYKDDFKIFKQFSAIAPTYAVLGNHDYGIGDINHTRLYNDQHQQLVKILEMSGVKVLIDENELFYFKEEKIQLVGFDEFWHLNKNPQQAIKNLEDEILTIGLSHNPDAVYLPESLKFDIILAGHTHGGQMRLPFIGALATAETMFPRTNYGLLVADSQPAILNTVGLGESGLPIRLFNKPEVVILKIK